jgi:chromate reductase
MRLIGRHDVNQMMKLAYHGKSAAIMSAAAAGYGGLRCLVFLRMLLGNIGVNVLTDQVTVAHAHKAFGSDGALIAEAKHHAVYALAEKLTSTVAKLART